MSTEPEVALRARIEQALAAAGLHVAVEVEGEIILLNGRADTAEARQAASDIVAAIAPNKRIDNSIEVDLTLPQMVGGLTSAEPSPSDDANSLAELRAREEEWEPDFTDQPLLADTESAGPDSEGPEDVAAEGGETYVPPTDPVITTDRHGRTVVLGGTEADSMEETQVAPSASDNVPGDEAIADAVRRELREDAATTDLEIDVSVEHGVVRLRGTVPYLDDADNAEAVAARVPGVREVIEELEVRNL